MLTILSYISFINHTIFSFNVFCHLILCALRQTINHPKHIEGQCVSREATLRNTLKFKPCVPDTTHLPTSHFTKRQEVHNTTLNDIVCVCYVCMHVCIDISTTTSSSGNPWDLRVNAFILERRSISLFVAFSSPLGVLFLFNKHFLKKGVYF